MQFFLIQDWRCKTASRHLSNSSRRSKKMKYNIPSSSSSPSGYIATILGNRDSVVGTATICNGLEGLWVECRQGKETFFFSVTSRPVLRPPSVLFNGHRDSFPGVKRPRRDVHHSPPSRVDVKNECSTDPSPTIRLDRVDRTDLPLPFVSILFFNNKKLPAVEGVYCCTLKRT
jgi:hypothetical protein